MKRSLCQKYALGLSPNGFELLERRNWPWLPPFHQGTHRLRDSVATPLGDWFSLLAFGSLFVRFTAIVRAYGTIRIGGWFRGPYMH
jgi:hypothetical protein